MTDRPDPLPPPLRPRPVLSPRALGILRGRAVAQDVQEVLQAYADLLARFGHVSVPEAVRDRAERLRRHFWIEPR